MINKLTNLPTPILGGGYSTDMQMASLEPCLNTSNIVYSRGDKVTINMGNSQEYSQIQDILGVFTQIALFSDDTQSLYAANIQDNLYSQSYHFYEQIVFPTEILLPTSFGVNALTPFGQGTYNSSIDQFRQECGDQFVSQMQYGATLFVSFQLVFASLSSKQTYENTIGTSGFAGLSDASTSTQEIITSQKLAGTMNLLAYQGGGNPSDLAQIFANNTNGYYITSCSFSSLTQCQQVINGVLNYAVNNFPNQVNITNGEIVGNAAPIGYTYLPYTILGLNASSTVITPEITQARDTLENLYNTLQEQNVFISHILGSWTNKYMTSDVLAYMQATLSNITYNINLLEDQNTGAITCFTQPSNCISIEQSLVALMSDVDESFIESFDTAFSLYCNTCCNTNLAVNALTGIAMPIGNNNYVKIQESGFIETLQIIHDGNTLTLYETNIGNGANVTSVLSLIGGNAYGGITDENGVGACYGYVIDNPV
jgi:hypothetical protein